MMSAAGAGAFPATRQSRVSYLSTRAPILLLLQPPASIAKELPQTEGYLLMKPAAGFAFEASFCQREVAQPPASIAKGLLQTVGYLLMVPAASAGGIHLCPFQMSPCDELGRDEITSVRKRKSPFCQDSFLFVRNIVNVVPKVLAEVAYY